MLNKWSAHSPRCWRRVRSTGVRAPFSSSPARSSCKFLQHSYQYCVKCFIYAQYKNAGAVMLTIFNFSHRQNSWKFLHLRRLLLQYMCILHCKEPMPKIQNKYYQKTNCVATVLIFTFMCLWAIYIPTIDLPILLQEICGPILGIYK